MVLHDTWRWLKQRVFPIPSTSTLFNPYGSNNPQYDKVDGIEIRRRNLLSYLSAFKQRPAVVVIGEAPGWRGCRFSGVPFTSEAQLSSGTLPFTGERSSIGPRPRVESSATLFWREMRALFPGFFAWNAIPLHPCKQDEPLSNRTPSAAEIDAHSELLGELLVLLEPLTIIALGRSAERASSRIGVPTQYVRHPSHGGAAEFRAGIGQVLARQASLC
jgi:uracil-DNA glycosylase